MAVVQEEGEKAAEDMASRPQGNECLFTALQHRLAGKMREW